MNEKILQTIKVVEDTIFYFNELIKLIDNLEGFSFLSEKFKLTLPGLIKMNKALEKIADYQRQIASFADLDEDTRRNWTYKIGSIKTDFNELLKKSRKISIDAFIYCDIDFYFSYTHKLLVIKRLLFFNSSRTTLVKNEFDKNDILELILK